MGEWGGRRGCGAGSRLGVGHGEIERFMRSQTVCALEQKGGRGQG